MFLYNRIKFDSIVHLYVFNCKTYLFNITFKIKNFIKTNLYLHLNWGKPELVGSTFVARDWENPENPYQIRNVR